MDVPLHPLPLTQDTGTRIRKLLAPLMLLCWQRHPMLVYVQPTQGHEPVAGILCHAIPIHSCPPPWTTGQPPALMMAVHVFATVIFLRVHLTYHHMHSLHLSDLPVGVDPLLVSTPPPALYLFLHIEVLSPFALGRLPFMPMTLLKPVWLSVS